MIPKIENFSLFLDFLKVFMIISFNSFLESVFGKWVFLSLGLFVFCKSLFSLPVVRLDRECCSFLKILFEVFFFLGWAISDFLKLISKVYSWLILVELLNFQELFIFLLWLLESNISLIWFFFKSFCKGRETSTYFYLREIEGLILWLSFFFLSSAKFFLSKSFGILMLCWYSATAFKSS